jgi:hypothetical protein
MKQRCVSFGALLILCMSAAAQMLSPGYALTGAPMSNFLSTSYLTQSVSNNLAKAPDAKFNRQASAQLRLKTEPLQVTGLKAYTSGPSVMPSKLALHYPPAQRPQAQALFEELLKRYAQVERQFDIPHGDLPAAVAAFLAGNWMGLHNTDFPDAQFKPVVEQMRSILAAEPRVQSAAETEKREMYEQMAILGMLMAGTQMGLKQQSDPATERAMRVTARSYLEQFLRTDADRIQMTSSGLIVK